MTLTAADLSTTDARRSPLVSRETFDEMERRGRDRLARLASGARLQPVGLSRRELPAILADATRDPWGGLTISAATGHPVSPTDPDAYAVTTRPAGVAGVTLAPGSSAEDFAHALHVARCQYADALALPGACLGVFHDADLQRVDIDPVLIVSGLDAAREIGAATGATGGAYCFADGLGYWPPHVAN